MTLIDKLFENCPLEHLAGKAAPFSLGARIESQLLDFWRPNRMPTRYLIKLPEESTLRRRRSLRLQTCPWKVRHAHAHRRREYLLVLSVRSL